MHAKFARHVTFATISHSIKFPEPTYFLQTFFDAAVNFIHIVRLGLSSPLI